MMRAAAAALLTFRWRSRCWRRSGRSRGRAVPRGATPGGSKRRDSDAIAQRGVGGGPGRREGAFEGGRGRGGPGIDSDACVGFAWTLRASERASMVLRRRQWLHRAGHASLRPIATIDTMVVAPRRHFVMGARSSSAWVQGRPYTRRRAHGDDRVRFEDIHASLPRVLSKKRLKADAFTTVGDTRYLVAPQLAPTDPQAPRLSGRVGPSPGFIGDARPSSSTEMLAAAE